MIKPVSSNDENPEYIPTEASELEVFNLETVRSEKDIEEEKPSSSRTHRSHKIVIPKEILPLLKPENFDQNSDFLSPLTLQKNPSIETPTSSSTLYEGQSPWNGNNFRLSKFNPTTSKVAANLPQKGATDMNNSSEFNTSENLVKVFPEVQSSSMIDEMDHREKPTTLIKHGQDEDTKSNEDEGYHFAFGKRKDSIGKNNKDKNVQLRATEFENEDNIQQQQRDLEISNSDSSQRPEIVLEQDNIINIETENENNVQVEIGQNTSPESNTNQESEEVVAHRVPEAGVYMVKVILFFFYTSCFSLFCLVAILAEWELTNLTGFAFIHPLSLIVIDLCWTSQFLEELWVETGEHFKLMDAANYIFALIILWLNMAKVIHFTLCGGFPFFCVALCYTFSSKKQLALVLTRWLYALQCILITLKLDDYIHFPWELVLIPSWIYLSCMIVSCIRRYYYLIKKVSFMNSQNPSLASRSSPKIGIAWYLLYYTLSIVAVLFLIGAAQALNSDSNIGFLKVMLCVVFVINMIICLYTLLKLEELTSFITSYGVIESHLARIYVEDLKPEKVISLQRENKASYFVKVSSTYFKPLHDSFFTKGQENLNKIKTMLSKLKPNYSLSYNSLKPETVGVNALKQDKEELDQRLNKMKSASNYAFKKINGKTRSEIPYNVVKKGLRRYSISNNNTTDTEIKEFAQEDDKEDSNAISSSKVEQEENVCYLCYDNPPDAILISCGHGGICYECASTFVKTKGECMQCRGQVEAIYRIDPNPKLDDIIKGVELTKVVID